MCQRLWHRCFPVNFVKFLGTPFLTEHLKCDGCKSEPCKTNSMEPFYENS